MTESLTIPRRDFGLSLAKTDTPLSPTVPIGESESQLLGSVLRHKTIVWARLPINGTSNRNLLS